MIKIVRSVPPDRYMLLKLTHSVTWKWNYFHWALLLRYWVSCSL